MIKDSTTVIGYLVAGYLEVASCLEGLNISYRD